MRTERQQRGGRGLATSQRGSRALGDSQRAGEEPSRFVGGGREEGQAADGGLACPGTRRLQAGPDPRSRIRDSPAGRCRRRRVPARQARGLRPEPEHRRGRCPGRASGPVLAAGRRRAGSIGTAPPGTTPGGAIGVGKTLTLVGRPPPCCTPGSVPMASGITPAGGGSIPIALILARWAAAWVFAQGKSGPLG